MRAVLLERSRTVLSDEAFVELSMRYDNERGKGDHRHHGEREEPFMFTTLGALLDAFEADVERMLR
ncbi:DUF6516 family protein [Methylorubrum podarium]|uniref:DUF6516 family protein n=1 Tax=Methylorubrum podarium TaxID=200476 RepID=A0ABV1QRR4_9HYPH